LTVLPSLGLLTLNALTAADSGIPIQCEYFGTWGFGQIIKYNKSIQKNT
jgi:cellulose biosynthesis protein BcsQ